MAKMAKFGDGANQVGLRNGAEKGKGKANYMLADNLCTHAHAWNQN